MEDGSSSTSDAKRGFGVRLESYFTLALVVGPVLHGRRTNASTAARVSEAIPRATRHVSFAKQAGAPLALEIPETGSVGLSARF